MNGNDILALPLGKNDSGSDTIGGYLVELLATLWGSGEGFSGKRPFGNSGWEYDLYLPLIKAGLVRGTIDEDGYTPFLPNTTAAHDLIAVAIRSLGGAK